MEALQRESGDTIYKVMGYTLAKSDTKGSYYAALPSSKWYINSPSSYTVIEQGSIPHTGVKI